MQCQGIGSSPFPARTGGQPAQSAVGKPPIQSDSLEEGLGPSPEAWSPRSSSSSVSSHQLVSHNFHAINPHKITSRIINPHKVTSGGARGWLPSTLFILVPDRPHRPHFPGQKNSTYWSSPLSTSPGCRAWG